MKKVGLFTIGLLIGAFSYSQTPNLTELKNFLFKSSFDTVEAILIIKGYSFERSIPYKEKEDSYTIYYFKKTNYEATSQELIAIYKKNNDPLQPFFERAFLSTNSSTVFYNLKKELPQDSKLKQELSEEKCLKRIYEFSFFAYQFNICQPEIEGNLPTYTVYISYNL